MRHELFMCKFMKREFSKLEFVEIMWYNFNCVSTLCVYILCMYVCMYAYMYACVCVCMYACTYACVCVCVYECMHNVLYAYLKLKKYGKECLIPWVYANIQRGSSISRVCICVGFEVGFAQIIQIPEIHNTLQTLLILPC